MTGILKAFLFGKFQFISAESDLALSHKALELFSFLLLYRDRCFFRETIANKLWGCDSGRGSRKEIRQSLWQLRMALNSHNMTGDSMLIIDEDWIQLNSQVSLWLDIACFEQEFDSVRGVQGGDLNKKKATRLQNAVRLYRGDLLEGWYQDWCIFERERFQSMYLSMLDKLLSYCEKNYEYEIGLTYADQILSYDQARERTHRGKIRLLYLAGKRSEALRQYHRCADLLKKELNVKPSRRTMTLYEQIRQDHFYAPSHISMVNTNEIFSDNANDPLPELLGNLKQCQATLGDVQNQLQINIQRVEDSLTNQR
ncbi:MAG: hypothetical protein JEZ06_08155 [Anaerolineaceae bacterium]|nr:hypothetical protein [Anaerolineaceae bacterium]